MLEREGCEERPCSMDRRRFLAMAGGSLAMLSSCAGRMRIGAGGGKKPNVVLILTDDHGFGDVGCHGNPQIRTPHLDQMAGEGIEFTHFFVSPVCSPTRSSLMTGRYNYRTGVVDTYLGRSMMHGDEVTLAEILSRAGYRTGIFGKWHLGDNAPMRPMEQGFQDSLVHKGGGIGQPSDPPGNRYHDPILQRNGVPERCKGYCSDIFTDAALSFMEANKGGPFFAYLAFNAPHVPLEIDDRTVAPYRAMGLDETTSKVYGMIANIDENVGKVLAGLDRMGIEEDSIVVFLTDNGPQQPRYNAGLRGLKGSVYDGGIRVPFFMRWSGALEPGRKISRMAAHIDLVPTLMDLAGVSKPQGLALDGLSLAPLLRGEDAAWPDRTLCFQWHRGDAPELYRDCAARTERFKLVCGRELYDVQADPAESNDVAQDHPDVVRELRAGYETWFEDVSSTRGYDPPRIYLGVDSEDPVILTRQDWRGPRASWDEKGLGYWEVDVRSAADYEVRVVFQSSKKGTVHLKMGAMERSIEVNDPMDAVVFSQVSLGPGPCRLETWAHAGGADVGADTVEVHRLRASSGAQKGI